MLLFVRAQEFPVKTDFPDLIVDEGRRWLSETGQPKRHSYLHMLVNPVSEHNCQVLKLWMALIPSGTKKTKTKKRGMNFLRLPVGMWCVDSCRSCLTSLIFFLTSLEQQQQQPFGLDREEMPSCWGSLALTGIINCRCLCECVRERERQREREDYEPVVATTLLLVLYMFSRRKK